MAARPDGESGRASESDERITRAAACWSPSRRFFCVKPPMITSARGHSKQVRSVHSSADGLGICSSGVIPILFTFAQVEIIRRDSKRSKLRTFVYYEMLISPVLNSSQKGRAYECMFGLR